MLLQDDGAAMFDARGDVCFHETTGCCDAPRPRRVLPRHDGAANDVATFHRRGDVATLDGRADGLLRTAAVMLQHSKTKLTVCFVQPRGDAATDVVTLDGRRYAARHVACFGSSGPVALKARR